MRFSNKYIAVVLLLMGLFHNCKGQFLPKKIRRLLTNCYDSSFSNQIKPFEIKGYYLFEERERQSYGAGRYKSYEDTFTYAVVFYNHGTYIHHLQGREKMNREEYANYVRLNGNAEERERLGFWGIYRIEGDYIIAQCIFDPGFKLQLYKWAIIETRYKILNNQTLKIISSQQWDGNGKTFVETPEEYSKPKYIPGRFISFNGLPSPDSWLKKVDGVWCK